ncbi:hypothetical protein KHA94_24725 [Bacillus sp. FJAT-49705]|uniref:Flp pilus-assembly TadG-like N-terminal domain-containing protein n=1 Tax=Cytobacillus citreus TaxID=2833586 RepID=A0ABS5P169_9BACI|nr:hypothetical protein [Cytobacillus citreus]MBS4193293.1 hypothetical protein [Cytobacillus citreus]
MKNVIENEKGNTMIFMLGSLSMLVLMFVIIGSFANVFIIKEKASNNAEQASMAASGEVLDGLKNAIELYDAYQLQHYTAMKRYDLYLEDSIKIQLRNEISQISGSNSDLSQIEITHKAVNKVIESKLPGIFGALEGFVNTELISATGRVHQVVRDNIESNNGELSGTKIKLFNKNNRVEVITATKYKAVKYDELFPEDKRKIKQKGEGLKFEFLNRFGNYNWEYTFP